LRFARGSANTNGDQSDLSVTVESHFGHRSGAASVSGVDEQALAAVVVRSEEIARLAPENRELLPPVGPQSYLAGAGYVAATAPAVRLEPGKYTVILEASAVSDMVSWMLWSMNARDADEGRSVFSRRGGGNRIGEKLFQDDVTIFTDPGDPAAPERVFGYEGL